MRQAVPASRARSALAMVVNGDIGTAALFPSRPPHHDIDMPPENRSFRLNDKSATTPHGGSARNHRLCDRCPQHRHVSGGVKLVEKRRFEIPGFFGHRTCFSGELEVPMALEMPGNHPTGRKKEEETWWNPGRRRNFKPPELPHFRLAADKARPRIHPPALICFTRGTGGCCKGATGALANFCQLGSVTRRDVGLA